MFNLCPEKTEDITKCLHLTAQIDFWQNSTFLVQWLSVQEKFTILEDDVKDANEPNIDDDQINERTAKMKATYKMKMI